MCVGVCVCVCVWVCVCVCELDITINHEAEVARVYWSDALDFLG